MRRPVLLIFTNAMILIVVFALLTQALVVVQRLAVAETLSGQVEVQRGGKGSFSALAAGEFIKTGDVVRSAADGTAEFKWADGTRWKIMPNTQITVKKSTTNMIKRADISQLQLSNGKVFVRIMKALKPASKFEIETPTAVAAVRGTIFSVEVAGGQTEVAVFKGEVNVQQAGGVAESVHPGHAILADSSGLKTVSSKTEDAEFAQQPTIVKPELEASVEKLDDGRILVRGTTEVGDIVRVEGDAVRVLGNGSFIKHLTPRAGQKMLTVTSTDKHGQTTTLSRPLEGCVVPVE